MNKLLVILFSLLLFACAKTEQATSEIVLDNTADETTTTVQETTEPAKSNAELLRAVLAEQGEEAMSRYQYRHPAETLEFFGIEPGMTVVEALPGGGWYSKILLPYLGSDGELIGVDYALDMFPLFGFFSEERIEAKKTWAPDWTADAREWFGDKGATVSAFVFGSQTSATHGTADAVLFIRALHNLARFESQGEFLTTALQDAHAVLKPGGVVGVVQHEAREDTADDWASGGAGYLKKSFVIEQFEKAGFELVSESDINTNPKDQPTVKDIVWRLPPSFNGTKDDAELKAAVTAIGESNRMTLLFRKPE